MANASMLMSSKGGFHYGRFDWRAKYVFASVGRPLDFISIIFARDGGKFKQNMAALNNRRRLFLLILLRRRLRKQKYKKRFWVRNILQKRKEKGEYHTLIQEAMLYDKEFFFVCFV